MPRARHVSLGSLLCLKFRRSKMSTTETQVDPTKVVTDQPASASPPGADPSTVNLNPVAALGDGTTSSEASTSTTLSQSSVGSVVTAASADGSDSPPDLSQAAFDNLKKHLLVVHAVDSQTRLPVPPQKIGSFLQSAYGVLIRHSCEMNNGKVLVEIPTGPAPHIVRAKIRAQMTHTTPGSVYAVNALMVSTEQVFKFVTLLHENGPVFTHPPGTKRSTLAQLQQEYEPLEPETAHGDGDEDNAACGDSSHQSHYDPGHVGDYLRSLEPHELQDVFLQLKSLMGARNTVPSGVRTQTLNFSVPAPPVEQLNYAAHPQPSSQRGVRPFDFTSSPPAGQSSFHQPSSSTPQSSRPGAGGPAHRIQPQPPGGGGASGGGGGGPGHPGGAGSGGGAGGGGGGGPPPSHGAGQGLFFPRPPPSSQPFQPNLLNNPNTWIKNLRFRTFSGEPPVKPEHATFRQWTKEILQALPLYPEPLVMEAVHKSCVNEALECVQSADPALSVTELVSYLDVYFGRVIDPDTLFAEFFHITQKKGESVNALVARMRKAAREINDARGFEVVGLPLLRDRLFHALRAELKSQARHQYDDVAMDFNSFLVYLRRVESGMRLEAKSTDSTTPAESVARKKKEASAKQTLADFTMDDLSAQISQLVNQQIQAQLGASVNMQSSSSSRSSTAQSSPAPTRSRGGSNSSNRGRSQGNMTRASSTGSLNNTRTAPQPQDARVTRLSLWCYTCGGRGHGSRECPSQPLDGPSAAAPLTSTNRTGDSRQGHPAPQRPPQAQAHQADAGVPSSTEGTSQDQVLQ